MSPLASYPAPALDLVRRRARPDGPGPDHTDRRTAPYRSADDLLRQARDGLHRLTPHEARHAQAGGALLVDVRAQAERVEEGEIPDALVLERNELEWQLDLDRPGTVVVICSEGRSSSLAAATLQLLGLRGATDLDGGFRAWRADGLPTVRGGTPSGERSRGGLLQVDPERWEVRVAGELVHLTSQEFRVLGALHEAGGRVVTRNGLAELLDVYPLGSRALDVHVCRLRRKLGVAGQQLVTVRGVGWRLLRA